MADSPFPRAVFLIGGLLLVSVLAVGAGLGFALARPESEALAGLPEPTRKQALELYSSVRWQPWNSDGYMRLGEFFLANNRPPAAIEWLHRATVWSSGNYQPWYYIGLAEKAAGRPAEAQAAFRKVLELNRDYIAARVQLANLMLESGQFDAAANAYTTLLRQGADQTRVQLSLGKALMGMGDNTGAAHAFTQALARFSAFGDLHAALSALLKAQGQNDFRVAREARLAFDFRNVVPLHTDDPLVEIMEHDFPTALTLFQGAARTRDLRTSIEMMERALSLDPKMTFGWEYLIALYGQAQRPKDAERAWESLRKLDPDSTRGRYELALAFTRTGNRARAADLLKEALAIDPGYAEARRMLGVNAQLDGNMAEAEGHFRAALATDPALAEAHVDLGLLLLKQGQTSTAQAEFLRALAPPCDQPERILTRELSALKDNPIVPSFVQALRAQALEQNRLALITQLNNAGTRRPPAIGLPDLMDPTPVNSAGR